MSGGVIQYKVSLMLVFPDKVLQLSSRQIVGIVLTYCQTLSYAYINLVEGQ